MKKVLCFIALYGAVSVTFGKSLFAYDSNSPCNTEIVNHSCTITIDRLRPVQPPPLQMYPNSVITVQLQNQFPFETPYLDWQNTTSTVPPDTSAAIVNTLLAQAKSISIYSTTSGAAFLSVRAAAPPSCPDPIPPKETIKEKEISDCLLYLHDRAVAFYHTIEPAANTNNIRPGLKFDISDWAPGKFSTWLENTLCIVYGSSAAIYKTKPTTCSYTDSIIDKEQALSVILSKLIDDKNKSVNNNISDGDARIYVGLATQADNIQKDLVTFAQRLLDLQEFPLSTTLGIGTIVDPAMTIKHKPSAVAPAAIPPDPPSCNTYTDAKPITDRTGFPFMVLRQVACSVDVINAVINQSEGLPAASQKKTIIAITAVFGDSRVETSAGALFSYIPWRTIVAQKIFTNNFNTQDHFQVQDQRIFPLVVPFAAVNIRVKGDFRLWNHRSAVYSTIFAGLNPNTSTADFGGGPSLSWRSVMVGPYFHLTHDIQLTQGFQIGQSLTNDFMPPPPTEKVWRPTFGLGISVRTATLTGR